MSAVWQKNGRHYPCKCGESAWNEKDFDFGKDMTRKFLELTGFKFSEDWEDFCSGHQKCHGKNSIDWNFSSGPGESAIPKKLKHSFKTCSAPKRHEIGKPRNDFGDMNGERELDEEDEDNEVDELEELDEADEADLPSLQESQKMQLEQWARKLEVKQARSRRG
jgi:hypothetical protein